MGEPVSTGLAFDAPRYLNECPDCGYPLRALPPRHRCPECGFPYNEQTRAFVAPRQPAWHLAWPALVSMTLIVCTFADLQARTGIGSEVHVLPFVLAAAWWVRIWRRRRRCIIVDERDVVYRERAVNVLCIPARRIRSAEYLPLSGEIVLRGESGEKVGVLPSLGTRSLTQQACDAINAVAGRNRGNGDSGAVE